MLIQKTKKEEINLKNGFTKSNKTKVIKISAVQTSQVWLSKGCVPAQQWFVIFCEEGDGLSFISSSTSSTFVTKTKQQKVKTDNCAKTT